MNIAINPNPEEVIRVRKEIEKNGGYCVCAVSKNEDTKCMCKEFRESKEEGFCYCGLYLKTKEKQNGR